MRSRAARIGLTTAGVVCVGLGSVGVVVPVLPTTPFLLLAAACFVRSSPRLHAWLVGHPRLGRYVAGFLEGGGLTRHAKRVTIVALWGFISLSIVLVAWRTTSRPAVIVVSGLLLAVAVLVTRYVVRRPTVPDEQA